MYGMSDAMPGACQWVYNAGLSRWVSDCITHNSADSKLKKHHKPPSYYKWEYCPFCGGEILYEDSNGEEEE